MRSVLWLECSCDGCDSPNWVRIGALHANSSPTHFDCWACRKRVQLTIFEATDPHDVVVVNGVLDPTNKDDA